MLLPIFLFGLFLWTLLLVVYLKLGGWLWPLFGTGEMLFLLAVLFREGLDTGMGVVPASNDGLLLPIVIMLLLTTVLMFNAVRKLRH